MTRPGGGAGPRDINVLAVDADPETLAAIGEALAGPKCRVVTASSGTEALRQMLKADFALIVLAVDLPGLDGLEVATLMRQVKRSSHIPIVFLTPPGGAPRPLFRGSGNGFVDYIAKPIDAGGLQSLVSEFARACGKSGQAEIGRVGEDLESIIRERTASLIRANDDLRREVARRECAEEALRTARLEAEAANSAKSEFLANMSHEIRTPMNGIVGLLELLLQTPLSAEQREYLDLVKVSAGALLTIINDILDFSKIEAGSLELERTAFSLRETVGDTMKALAFEASRKGLELACEIDPDMPDGLLGDPVRLRQIVTNLVGNAVKFTASGEVLLCARLTASQAGEVACDFSIRDTGIGIPADKLKTIFAPFCQGDTSTTRVYGGTGLGLSIAARLVEMMGGTLDVDSTVGRGSRFGFTLRFGAPPEGARRPPDFAGLRVLAAVHRTSRKALVDDLRRWRVDVVEADHGAAVQARLDAAQPFDLLLLDDSLPGGDVFELAERIRRGAHAGVGAVAVLSTLARRRDAPGSDGTGFVPLTKPVKQSELLTLMNAIAGRHAPPQPPAAVPVANPVKPLDVLLVEDNAINCRLAQQVLTRAGHRVATADNGAAALVALAAGRFDVVLMDVQMPGMDGIEATRLIREGERCSGGHVPVIALTAHAMVQHRERCLKAGMDGFLVKPIRPQDLLDAVAGIERVVRRAAPPRKRRVDRAALWERVGGDARLLQEVIDMLNDKGLGLLAQARGELAARSEAPCARLLHSLAGMFASLAAEAAAEMAARLEELVAAGHWELAAAEFARLEREAQRLGGELAAMAGERRRGTLAMSVGDGAALARGA